MLSIGLLGAHQEKYYTELLSREDYYTRGGEPPGEWFGSGAEQLGLSGEVSARALSDLFKGIAPDDGRKLVRNAGSETRRAGFDLTFNAPKSVSVLFSQLDDAAREEIQAAQAEAVRSALSYVERSACWVRTGTNGVDSSRASFAAALFEHSSARLTPGETIPDPHLHTHAVIANVGFTQDGRSRTLDSRELLRHKMAAGGLYRSELFRQLEIRLGLTASRREKWVEIDGVPTELLEHFSKRRRAIESELDPGAAYGKATDQAALRTRTHKPTVDRVRFLEEWRRIGQELGFDPTTLPLASQVRLKRPLRRLREQAIKEALAKLTQERSHFGERELVRALADLLEDKGAGAANVLRAARACLRSRRCIRVGESKGEARFTTREVLQLERRMLSAARDLSRRSHRVASDTAQAVVTQLERAGTALSPEQHRAFLHLTQGRALSLVRGVAGTGKTFMLAAARRAWEQDGHQVVGVALASRAAKQLEDDSGIRSSTIHSFLRSLETGRTSLKPRSVLVVDEAGMVGTRQMERLATHVAAAGAKLALVGDDRQLQAIEAGAPFAGMRRRFGATEMSEIRRQRDGWAREAVHEFSRGEARQALTRLAERGQVRVAKTRTETVAELVRDYRESASISGFSECLILTGTRSEARRVNREVQLHRKLAGELGEDRVVLGETTFSSGDRVIFRKNSRRLGVRNGDRGVLVATAEDCATVRLDSGERITVHRDSAPLVRLELGYASTTHSAQGATVERCFVLAGGAMQDREATYVQASRARAETRIYTDETTAGAELVELTRAMERSRAKDLASDLLEPALTQTLEAVA